MQNPVDVLKSYFLILKADQKFKKRGLQLTWSKSLGVAYTNKAGIVHFSLERGKRKMHNHKSGLQY